MIPVISRVSRETLCMALDAKALTPDEEMTISRYLRLSEVYAAYYHSEIMCVWGLVPPTLLSDKAYIWSYTTQVALDNKFLFVRNSQHVIGMMHKEYPILIGHTYNPESTKWLRWLGAEFQPFDEYGKAYFEIRKKHG